MESELLGEKANPKARKWKPESVPECKNDEGIQK